MSLYHETAALLSAPTTHGGSLKSRVFKKDSGLKSPPAQVYALALESCKWSAVLSEVIDNAGLLKAERKLTPPLALLLAHDLLLSKSARIALPATHGLSQSLTRHRARLASELTRARLRRGHATLASLRAEVDAAAAGPPHPRWVRVNALRTTLDAQLGTTFAGWEVVASVGAVLDPANAGKKVLCLDGHVPNLVGLAPGAGAEGIVKSRAYREGEVVLQDKASCFPACLLDPREGDVVDACAAPGNKTTHLAGMMAERGGEGRVFAFEKDRRRAEVLGEMVAKAGGEGVVVVNKGVDFLKVDPMEKRYKGVGGLLLDPSCSGSGIVGRDEMPELVLPEAVGAAPAAVVPGKKRKRNPAEKEEKRPPPATPMVLVDDDGDTTTLTSEAALQERIRSLAAFQLALVQHAMKFPAATRITYSTCSVYAGENEHVVVAALASDVARQRGWRILKRADQVRGMREWEVRGDRAACDGDEDVAEGCIRTYRDDGRGVMGFFVAGFVRDGEGGGEEEGDGPYVRDEAGMIVRDAEGIPTLKSTGKKAIEVEESEEGSEDGWGGFED
ncbi:NOL1/NOP2/sun family protein [Podospora conica]|nr:NOL1/NOP2/sun family protein [Schizothecium conicum]